MRLEDARLPTVVADVLREEGIESFRPSQEKALKAGVLEGKSMLVCTPTASGKTLVGEMAALNAISNGSKALYIVPLVALANEKAREFRKRYSRFVKVALSVGESDGGSLVDKDLIVCTAEKLDSLMRHHTPWLSSVKAVVVDEIHLLNDPSRGPTLEIVLTMLRKIVPQAQVVGLSATIGNPEELAEWLGAELVLDGWRPVPLKQGVFWNGSFEFS